jgi:hypothetical protein
MPVNWERSRGLLEVTKGQVTTIFALIGLIHSSLGCFMTSKPLTFKAFEQVLRLIGILFLSC